MHVLTFCILVPNKMHFLSWTQFASRHPFSRMFNVLGKICEATKASNVEFQANPPLVNPAVCCAGVFGAGHISQEPSCKGGVSSEFWFYGSSRRYDANCVNRGELCNPSKNYDNNGKSPCLIGDTSSNVLGFPWSY